MKTNSSVANIRAIAKRELSSYFTSPVAYVFLVIFLLLAGFFTFTVGSFFERGEASLASFFSWHPWIYLVLVPAVGMRVWSEERRSGTMELLLTMPVNAWEAILAKFLASWAFLAIALALTFPIVVTVNELGSPDNGMIAAGYIGSFLLAGAYLAITCMTSALTRNQVIAFIKCIRLGCVDSQYTQHLTLIAEREHSHRAMSQLERARPIGDEVRVGGQVLHDNWLPGADGSA